MRKILFRGFMPDSPTQTLQGKDKIILDNKVVYGEWAYGYLADKNTIDEYKEIELDGKKVEIFKRRCIVIPETIGEYTGLTDKNENKIFDGDIVQFDYLGEKTKGIIIYDNEMDCYSIEFIGENHGCCDFLMNYSQYDLEVIGNIYDTPKLLEVNNENN